MVFEIIINVSGAISHVKTAQLGDLPPTVDTPGISYLLELCPHITFKKKGINETL